MQDKTVWRMKKTVLEISCFMNYSRFFGQKKTSARDREDVFLIRNEISYALLTRSA